MIVVDVMVALLYLAMFCLMVGAIDAVCLLAMYVRDRRRLRRARCACGGWTLDWFEPGVDDPLLVAGWLHESSRCYPALESAP